MTVALFVAGLALLVAGADLLVRGASRLAGSLGMSPLIVGLTVVAFGTSAPEFAVSLKSALEGQASLAVGNVVGSNIFNVLLILGLSALICPLVVSKQLIRLDVPLMIAASVLAFVLAGDHQLSRLDGLLLFGSLVAYTAFLIYYSRKTSEKTEVTSAAAQPTSRTVGKNSAFIVGGLALLVLGSQWLVSSAISFAKWFAVSEEVIGLTIVAAGTSLPELVTSIVASIRCERDIAVGNVVGSNLFNLLGVLGLSALASPSAIDVAPTSLSFDFPFMTAVAFACLPVFFTGGIISRWEGGFLLTYYFAYTGYIVGFATRHEKLPMFQAAMIYFVIPLTAVTLIVAMARAFRRARRSSRASK